MVGGGRNHRSRLVKGTTSEIFGFSAMVPFADRREHCEVALPKVAEHQLERHD